VNFPYAVGSVKALFLDNRYIINQKLLEMV